MTEIHPDKQDDPTESEAPITIREILRENWVLTRALIVFILMLSVPLFVAWKNDLFTVANP